MRLALFIASLGSGGAERVLTCLANAWSEQGHNVTLITFDSAQPFYPLSPGVAHRPLTLRHDASTIAGGLLNNVRRVARVRGVIKAIEPDCIVSFLDQVNTITALAAVGTGVRVLVSERVDPTMAPISRLWRTLRTSSYFLADGIVVQTADAATAIPSWARRKVITIHNPVVAQPTRMRGARGHGTRQVIVAVGRLAHQKGHDLLLEAFAGLAEEYPTWDLVVAGEGPARSTLETHRARLGLSARVSFPGLTDDVTGTLDAADLFVLPSRFEGFPNALCEAMSHGLPDVATDCPSGPREIVRDGIDGLLVPTGDTAALAQAMRRLMADEKARLEMGRRAREVTDRFSVEAALDAWRVAMSDTSRA